jgi:hypothetical protein
MIRIYVISQINVALAKKKSGNSDYKTKITKNGEMENIREAFFPNNSNI